MATKNKKDTVSDLLFNIFDNNVKGITPVKNRVPFNSIINSVAFNITIAQLRLEDDSAEHSLAHIIDAGKQGVFYFDTNDITTIDDGISCIVTSTGRRYKRLIQRKFDARWTGAITPYFTTVALANAAIPMPIRFIGMEVDILIGGSSLTTYWYRDGVGDSNLITKGSDIFVIDFTVGDGQSYTPTDNTDTLTNPALIGKSIVLFLYANARMKISTYPNTLGIVSTYAQFNNATGALKLQNGLYSNDSDGLIIYK